MSGKVAKQRHNKDSLPECVDISLAFLTVVKEHSVSTYVFSHRRVIVRENLVHDACNTHTRETLATPARSSPQSADEQTNSESEEFCNVCHSHTRIRNLQFAHHFTRYFSVGMLAWQTVSFRKQYHWGNTKTESEGESKRE